MSSVKGISWRASANAYVVRPTWKRTTFYVGAFPSFEDAEDALEQFNALTGNVALNSHEDDIGQIKEVQDALATARSARKRQRKRQKTAKRMDLTQKVTELEERVARLESRR